MIKLSTLKTNPNNPRLIKDDKFMKLVKSLETFPQMMELRPIIVDENNVIQGGNMRFKALLHLGFKEIPESYVKQGKELTAEQWREFVIKDNVGFGEWNWEDLANEWNIEDLEMWGLDLPLITETEKLSELKFEDIYYTPENKPNIELKNCLNLDKFNTKLEIIENSDLSIEQKETLKMFAYRFIKIDFENIANYYFFNASEEEQKIIERLRLVLCDSGLNGFIEDELLMIHEQIEGWEND